MKAKELMIGDWVQIIEPCKYAGAIGRIKTLIDHKDEENAYFKVFLQNNTKHIGIEDICSEDIRPIPLTPEILEKNGFIRDMFYGEWQFDLDPFPFSVVQRENNSWYLGREEYGIAHNREIIDISHVHELQHAIRLCGIEKEIEL